MILARYRNSFTYFLYTLIYLSVAVRGIADFNAQGNRHAVPAVFLILLYGFLLASERWITRRLSWYIHLYLALQTGIIFSLIALGSQQDYFALLFIPLSTQAMLHLPIRSGYYWIAIFTLVTWIGLIMGYGTQDALPFMFIYAAAYLFVASYATTTRQAQEAQQRSEVLLEELQGAHIQLQEYADQAQELAVMEERTRLARDLHDSVTQALYSLTLYSAAAARQLAAGEVQLTAEHLQELQLTAQQALQEMRLLIFELRPAALEEAGLAGAIAARIEAVETRTGMQATLEVDGDEPLPPAVEEGLYRITQEALNNTLKHAQADQVHVRLARYPQQAILDIEDNGIGFETAAANHSGGLGLAGIKERAEQLNAQLTISSIPGQGTRIHVEVPL